MPKVRKNCLLGSTITCKPLARRSWKSVSPPGSLICSMACSFLRGRTEDVGGVQLQMPHGPDHTIQGHGLNGLHHLFDAAQLLMDDPDEIAVHEAGGVILHAAHGTDQTPLGLLQFLCADPPLLDIPDQPLDNLHSLLLLLAADARGDGQKALTPLQAGT